MARSLFPTVALDVTRNAKQLQKRVRIFASTRNRPIGYRSEWKIVRPFAETEMKKLAETAVQIQFGQADRRLTRAHASASTEGAIESYAR